MKRIKLFGLFAQNELPTMELVDQTDNEEHINLIELARSAFLLNPGKYDAIAVVVGRDELRVWSFK